MAASSAALSVYRSGGCGGGARPVRKEQRRLLELLVGGAAEAVLAAVRALALTGKKMSFSEVLKMMIWSCYRK